VSSGGVDKARVKIVSHVEGVLLKVDDERRERGLVVNKNKGKEECGVGCWCWGFYSVVLSAPEGQKSTSLTSVGVSALLGGLWLMNVETVSIVA